MQAMTIGRVARDSGVGVETVRFYERQGLVDEPPRRASGYRQYPAETVRRIRFIRRAKELGFSLREIRDLLDLRLEPDVGAADIRERVRAKIVDIDGKLQTLQRMRHALEHLTAACEASGADLADCPILKSLEDEL